MPLLYGEGREKAINRLKRKIDKTLRSAYPSYNPRNTLSHSLKYTATPQIGDRAPDTTIETQNQ